MNKGIKCALAGAGLFGLVWLASSIKSGIELQDVVNDEAEAIAANETRMIKEGFSIGITDRNADINKCSAQYGSSLRECIESKTFGFGLGKDCFVPYTEKHKSCVLGYQEQRFKNYMKSRNNYIPSKKSLGR